MVKNFSNLTGKVLVASPHAMEGNVFYHSLIYIMQHSKDGSLGLIFNQVVPGACTSNMFTKLNPSIKIDTTTLKTSVHLGGPVDIERGFFLHSAEYQKNVLFANDTSHLAVSSNVEILRDMTTGKGPKDTIFIIGYTSWGEGQIESEIAQNLWIITEPTCNMIFSEETTEKKWQKVLSSTGISMRDFIVHNHISC